MTKKITASTDWTVSYCEDGRTYFDDVHLRATVTEDGEEWDLTELEIAQATEKVIGGRTVLFWDYGPFPDSSFMQGMKSALWQQIEADPFFAGKAREALFEAATGIAEQAAYDRAEEMEASV